MHAITFVPRPLDMFAVAGGFGVHFHSQDTEDDSQGTVELFTGAAPVRLPVYACKVRDIQLGCVWDLGPGRAGVLTDGEVVLFTAPAVRRERTGFRPTGQPHAMVLDAAHSRLCALRDQPLGAVEVYDLTARRVVRSVAPAAPGGAPARLTTSYDGDARTMAPAHMAQAYPTDERH